MFITIGILSLFTGDTISTEIAKRIAPEYYADVIRLKNIDVFKTRTGERYHRGYHYSKRNSRVDLYTALKKGLTPCQVCKPIRATLPAREGIVLIVLLLRLLVTVLPFLTAYLVWYRKEWESS